MQRALRGSWVVRSGVISRVTIIITHIRGLITPLISTLESSNMRLLTKMTVQVLVRMKMCWRMLMRIMPFNYYPKGP